MIEYNWLGIGKTKGKGFYRKYNRGAYVFHGDELFPMIKALLEG